MGKKSKTKARERFKSLHPEGRKAWAKEKKELRKKKEMMRNGTIPQ